MWFRLRSAAGLAALLVWCGSAAAQGDAGLRQLQAAIQANSAERVRASTERLLAGAGNEQDLLRAGAMLAGSDRLRDAARVFEECARRFPASFEAKYNLALARIGLNDVEAARKTVASMTPAGARETAARDYLEGKLYEAAGRAQEARTSLERAYRGNPGEENYALDLGLLYIRSSEYVPAIGVLEASLKRHPASDELALELALAEALAGRQADAAAVCRKLIAQDPELGTARVIEAFSGCMRADYVACRAAAEAGLGRPHPNPYLHYLYAEAMWNSDSGERTKVLDELGAAVEAMPGCTACLLLRSKVLEQGHQDGAAIADLTNAVAADGQLAPAWYRLSVLYRKTGRSAEAEEAIRRYRALEQSQVNGEIESFRRQLLGNKDSQTSR